jgi:FkbM family methyltransferase
MKILGRRPSRYLANLVQIPEYARLFWKCRRIFRHPTTVIRSYITRRPVPDGTIVLRSGLVLHLSADPLDVVTVFGVFVREDYGRVPAGAVVVDIGANIGVFTMYAVHCGARRVEAYEPSAQSFDQLEKNISANGLAGRAVARRAAVWDGSSSTVAFPRHSSVMNAVLADAGAAVHDIVPATTLDTVVADAGVVDLLKMDCEGAEGPILAAASAAALSGVHQVRLEYHLGLGDQVEARLRGAGFRTVYKWAPNAEGGILWMARPQG